MTAEYKVHGDIAVITLNNPPVNGLGLSTRQGIAQRQPSVLAAFEPEWPIKPIAGKAFGEVPPPSLLPEEQDIGLIKMPIEIAEQTGRWTGETERFNVATQGLAINGKRHVRAVSRRTAPRIFSVIIGVGEGAIGDVAMRAQPA